uniref:Clone 1615 transcribed RNA sequence n=1 Tax=Plectreurys tristis TaxID=33319 RepID=A0A0C4W807_PLETR|nr:hypothetical protein [Plectreurys tristis]
MRTEKSYMARSRKCMNKECMRMEMSYTKGKGHVLMKQQHVMKGLNKKIIL